MLPEERRTRTPSVFKRAIERFKAHEEQRAIAALPLRFTRHRCASTGGRYVIEWRAETKGGPYKRAALQMLEDETNQPSGSARYGVATHKDTADYDTAEFDWSGHDTCACCGHTRLFVHCSCGEIVCGARSAFQGSRIATFRCDESCDKRFPVFLGESVEKVRGSESADNQTPALPGSAKVLADQRSRSK